MGESHQSNYNTVVEEKWYSQRGYRFEVGKGFQIRMEMFRNN